MKPKPSPNVSSSSKKPSPRPHRLVKQVQAKKNDEPSKTKQDKAKVDISVIRYPVHTSVGNISQLLDVVNKATPEVISLVNRECSIIFECKICKNLFRSLANFLSHKRGYCKGTVNEFKEFRSDVPHEEIQKNSMVHSRSTTRKDVLALLESFKNHSVQSLLADNILLKDISATNEAYFNLRYQNQDPTKEKIVTIDPVETPEVNGHCESDDKANNTCGVCYKEFLYRKSLDDHVKKDHEDLRVCFVCPCCKKYFANAWSVYRHMYKVHRKTSEQVRKLRTQIQKKQVTQEEFNRSKKGNMASPQEKKNQDKAFMEDLRGHGSVQCCPECGKHFERKAALVAHAAHCQKRSLPPPDLARSLKRKALAPMKVVEEKKAKFSSSITDEIITQIRNFDPRVVLTKADLPQMYEKSSSKGGSEENLNSECVTDLKSLLQRYRDEVALDEDVLNKIHSEVPIEETAYSSESENDYNFKGFTSSRSRYSITPERDYLSQDGDSLSHDKETISHDRENISQDRESISQDRESISQDKDSLSQDRESVSQDRDSLLPDEEGLSQDKECESQDEDNISQDEGSASESENSASQDDDSALEDEESVLQDENILSEDCDYLSEDEEQHDITYDNNDIEEFEDDEKSDEDAGSSLSVLEDEERENLLMEKKEDRKEIFEDEINDQKLENVEIEEVDEKNIEIQEISPENSDILLDDINDQDFDMSEHKEVSNSKLVINAVDNNNIKTVPSFRQDFHNTEAQCENSKSAKVSIKESLIQLEANDSRIFSRENMTKITDRASKQTSSAADEKVGGYISDLDDLECNGFMGFSDPESDSENELETSSPLNNRRKITPQDYENISEQNSKDCLSLEADKDNTCDNMSHSSYISMKHQSVFIESCRGETSRGEGSSPTFDLDESDYGVAKEIILFNYSEGSMSCSEKTEICVDKENVNNINGGSTSSSPVSESHSHDPDDDESPLDKSDWVTKKINSFMIAPKKKCLLCYKTFHRVNFVRRHVASHFNINKFKCLVNSCNFQSYFRSDMNNHLLRTHKTKEIENFVGRLYPKKEDFSEDLYIPDPKPMYAFEKSFKPHSSNVNKENDFRITEKEEEISSSLTLEDESLDGLNIGEEMEIIEEHPQTLICKDLEDVTLRSLASEEPNKEKLKTLMMEVIFGHKNEEDSEDSSLLAS